MLRSLIRKLISFSLGACLAPVVAGASPIAKVWAVNDGEKIERDDRANRDRVKNFAWDGRRIKIFGARNEVLAFQLIVEAGDKGIEQLRVRLSELKRRGGSEKISYAPPTADPTLYAGRPIQLFTVNYMLVSKVTRASWVWIPDSPAAPRDGLGWKPVQLIPENARADRGGFPLKVAPNQNQAVWIEVYTTRDLTAGLYEGRVEIEADGERRSVPVELELFDFTLPDENSMGAMVFYQSAQPELYHGRNLDDAYHRFAHRHRVEFVNAYDISSLRLAAKRFNGEDFTRARGYEGPGEGVGNRIAPASFYGPPPEYEQRESAWRAADEWMTFINASFPRAITFLYMPDEPRPAEFARIRNIADNVHSNPGPGKKLPIFVTHRYVKELDGAIDIWDSGPEGYDVARASSERAAGRDYWVYNGGRPALGSIVIDSPATDSRATIWACFKHGINVYFYWHGVHWRHNSQKQGVREQNVWAEPVTFDNRGQPRKPIDGQGYINGDGVLLYPGEDKLHPAEDRGLGGPVSTVQLANFRRGLQDHQYLSLGRKLGLTRLVDDAVRGIVPRVFSEAGSTVTFAENGDEFEKVRYQLARAVAAASKGRN